MSPRIALVLTLGIASASAAEVTLDAHRFTLPEGYTIEVAAGADLVPRPMAAAFDEQGRLYVTDSSGSNAKTDQQLIDRPHRVVRLEDTDGDGRFDRSIVFADRLMLPQGAMWREGSLYVAAPPSIWKLTDSDGDGIADQREEWYAGQTLTGCANDLHGPYAAPDGWIYWCKGAFAEQTHERPGRPPLRDRASHIFRCRADGSGVESVMSGGMDNPVDVDFTRTGEPIFTSTFLDLSGDGKRDGLGHSVYGGVFPKVNDVTDGVTRTGELLPAMAHFGPGAPCGFTRIEGRGLGDDLRDNFLACLFNLHKVTRHALEPVGSTFRTRDSDFLRSDNADFHPTDVIEDADGSLLVVDTGGWYKLCCPTSQLAKPDVLGAIYRIRRTGAPKITDPRGLQLDWAKADAATLAARLADERPAVAARAATSLATLGAAALVPVGEFVKANAGDSRQRALWVLSRIADPAALPPVRAALTDAAPEIRQTAAKILGLRRDPAAVPPLIAQLADASPALRRVAAEALGRIGDRVAVFALLAATRAADVDRFLEHALIYALIEIGAADATAAGLAEDRPVAERRAALIALSEMDQPGVSARTVFALLAAPDAGLKTTAAWVAGRHPEWAGEVATFFREQLTAPTLSAADRENLESLLASMARDPAVQQLITDLLRGTAPAAITSALRAIDRAELKTTPLDWLEPLSTLLTVVRHPVAVDAANRFISRKEAALLIPALLTFAGDEKQREDLRLLALSNLPAGSLAPDAALFTLLTAQLADLHSAARIAAALILARARLNDPQRDALIALLPTLGALEFTRLLPAFERPLAAPAATRLLDALARSPALASCPPQSLRAIFAKLPADSQPAAEQLLARFNFDTTQQRAKLDAIAAELPSGDIRRGQLVFNSAKAACTICHAMGYLGGKFGPDLTAIGEVRNERDLLEAIVFPSASLVRSYEPMRVRLKAGTELAGLVLRESGDALTLGFAPGVEQRIARSDIAELQPGTTSLMPQGFDQLLTRAELADLVAFLRASTRKPR